MKISFDTTRAALCFAIAAASTFAMDLQSGSASTLAPGDTATSPEAAMRRTPQQIVAEMTSDQKTVNDLLGKGNAALKDSKDRIDVAPKLLPLIERMRGDLNDLSAAVPELKEQIGGSQMQLLALLSALGEKDATDQINAMATSKDPTQAANGQGHLLMARFYLTDNSTKSQTELADDVEKLDRSNSDSVLLTQMTIEMGNEETLPELKSRLLDIAANEMNNSAASSLKERLAAKKEAADQDALVTNKPLTLSGTLVDGKAFSTDSLKGKVILVDFWATWCGPCKAELPRVKKMYEDYHAKGLEVVGVSNDYDAEALKGFVLNAEMPWPQFFDADAAAKHEWNALTVNQKIDGIPVMYLIDKKGLLRTVNARQNMQELIPQLLAESN